MNGIDAVGLATGEYFKSIGGNGAHALMHPKTEKYKQAFNTCSTNRKMGY